MATISDIIDDYAPANEDVSVSLLATIEILFDREMDEDFLEETLFITGPDTDQFVGPNLDLLEYPDNVSEGDDFLESPGRTGIVQGAVTFANIDPTDADTETESTPYRTKWIFTPTRALAALTEYTAHIPEAKDLDGTTYEGYTTFSFTTGTGSIVALPSSGSTSVLGKSGSQDTSELEITKTTPADRAVQIDPETKTITIEFSTILDSDTVTTDKFIIKAEPATDHPNAAVSYSEEELIKTLEITGNKVIISI